jgi:hypothetical protein
MNEVEKLKHTIQKYKDSERVYTVYKREESKYGNVFTLIYGTDDRQKVKDYIQKKESQGKKLIVYCARPQERASSLYYRTED